LITGIVVVLAARCAAQYHIGYPVIARSIFGMYGSFFFIFFRATVACIWYGINTFYGGNLLSTCLFCMFGHSWKNFPNHLPESASITSAQLLCFFLTLIIQAPFTLLHPRNAHWVFVVKGTFMPIATFGLFGWCMANGAGISAIGNPLAKQSDTPLGWALLSGINSVIGISAGLLVSQPDMASKFAHSLDLCTFINHVFLSRILCQHDSRRYSPRLLSGHSQATRSFPWSCIYGVDAGEMGNGVLEHLGPQQRHPRA
jgi:NCS1 family nucleobase:cation symporter-1